VLTVASGAITRQFVGVPSPTAGVGGAGGHPCQGLYVTAAGHRPSVALVACHYDVDFSEHYLGPLVAEHGVGFLGWNIRSRGHDAHLLADHALVDVGAGVRWLREEAGVTTVVLVGNSGGGSLMAAYQHQATEPGAVAPVAGMRPAAGLDDLPPGDALVAIAAHLGRPDVLTAWMDPSVVDETDPASTDPTLDLWAAGRTPPFDLAFLATYRRAQVARNDRITAWAEAELIRLRAAGVSDRLFAVPRTWADPRMVDPTLDPSARPPNRCYLGDPRRANRSAWGLAATATLRTWLAMWSLRRSPLRAEPHLRRLSVPALVVTADADCGVFPSDSRRFADAVAADARQAGSAPPVTSVTLPGDHYFADPPDARRRLADTVAGWVLGQFGSG
jgi:dienelactone hydrolase